MTFIYLASGSHSRQKLLQEAKISFKLLSQNADESKCGWSLPLKELVELIADFKMDHVILPSGKEGDEIRVLTADTLTLDGNGEIAGKPKSKKEVVERIKSYRKGAVTGSAFCLSTKKFRNDVWQEVDRVLGYSQAEYIFDIPDHKIDWYLQNAFEGISFMNVSGGVMVDGAGAQFVKEIKGSYTAILGLPMYELSKIIL